MTRGCCKILCVLLVALAAPLAGCHKAPHVLPPENTGESSGDVTSPSAPSRAGRWRLREVQAEVQLEDDQRFAGLDVAAMEASFRMAIADLPEMVATPTTQTPLGPRDQAAVHVEVAWQRMDDAHKVRPMAGQGAGTLLVQVVAHVEAPGVRKTENDVAERSAHLSLIVPETVADWQAWLLPRLQRAVATATSEALGELWARDAPEAELQAALQQRDTWKLVAAIREVGERKLRNQRSRLEKLALDSRKDVAASAAAALGRLGDAASVPVLRQLTDRPQLEVIDAAVVALAAIKDPAATGALTDIAANHPVELVRRRAAGLADLTTRTTAPAQGDH